jgi:sterol desaturase/sphingolipid hydroxylase (fatty acid hydroxylase superfamily)
MESPITQATVYAVGVPIILLLIALEAGVSAWKNTHFYDARDSAGTLGMLLGNIAMAAATKTAVLGMYFSLYPFRLVDINDLLPPWAVWVLTFIAIDFVFYWYHRWSHRVRCLWAVGCAYESPL